MASTIKRSLFKSFLNTGIVATPVWSLINTGVTSATVGMNPKTTEEVYIHQDSGSISVDSYAPTLPVEASAVNGSAIFEYLDAKRKSRAVLSDAETEIVNVWLYKGSTGGLYLAERQSVSIPLDKFGGEGGKAVVLGYTINYIGDPVVGTFDPATLTFVPCEEGAKLASLVITDVPLTPQFRGKRIFYTAETTNATDEITAVAVDGDSVITVDLNGEDAEAVDGVVAAASWDEGLNTVVVTSTVASPAAVAKYYIFVTATLGA
jgi:hypothetical protein